MTPLLNRYPFDPSGKSLNNTVINDPYMPDRKAKRSIAIRYGSFYSKSVVVKDAATNEVLTRGRHYSFTCLNAEAMVRTGLEVHQVIVITEPTVSDKVLVSYQVVGGEYSSFINAIEQLLKTAGSDTRQVYWPNIKDLPSGFEPEKHTHDIGDIYNFNQFVYKTDQIRQSMEVAATLELDDIYRKTDQYAAEMGDKTDQLTQLIQAHLDNQNNPHNTTAAQIDSYIKSQVDTMFVNLNTTIQGYLDRATTNLNSHLNAVNPHNDTAANIGTLTGTQMEAAIQAALAANPSGADGNWTYLYGSYTYAYSDVNPYAVAVMYSVSCQSTGDRGTAQRIYVNGTLITNGYTLVYRDPKSTQGMVMVPAGGSIYVDCNANGQACRPLVYRFTPKGV